MDFKPISHPFFLLYKLKQPIVSGFHVYIRGSSLTNLEEKFNPVIRLLFPSFNKLLLDYFPASGLIICTF